MMPQREISESPDEQTGPTYGKYEGEQEYIRPRSEMSYEQMLRDRPAEKVYPPMMDSTNMFRLLVFIVSMVSLLAFVFVCLVVVQGTGGWIAFCAASFTIMVIASTLISMKRGGEK